jgi:hypothetical protein
VINYRAAPGGAPTPTEGLDQEVSPDPMKNLSVRFAQARESLGRRVATSKRAEIAQLAHELFLLRKEVRKLTADSMVLTMKIQMQELAEAERAAFEAIRRHEEPNW